MVCGGVKPEDLAVCLPDMLAYQLAAGDDLPVPEREVRFHATRRWRWDLSWKDAMLAVEVDGGTWVRSRHTTGKGFQGDCDKTNAGVLAGWRVYRFTRQDVESGAAAALVRRALDRAEEGE